MTIDIPRKSGLYGLVNLDGAPLDARDCSALGLAAPVGPVAGMVEAVDARSPDAAQRLSMGSITLVLAGELDHRAELTARLGLSPTTPAVRLAFHALARFGDSLPVEMAGEWSLLQWDRRGGCVILSQSAARRDPLLYARSGNRLAVAPDVYRLGRIDWVGGAFDEAGFLLALGRAQLRERGDDRTITRGVRQLPNGATLTIAANGTDRLAHADILLPPPRFGGSLADAVAETERILRGVMRDRLARSSRPAILLSGGLDSSLLAWLGKAERKTPRDVLAITAVAPDGSGIADERTFAAIVADHLAMQLIPVAPGAALDAYRPSAALFAGDNGPPLSNRHVLTEAFHRAAQDHGATSLVNGTYGEMTATARVAATGLLARGRRLAARVRRGLAPARPTFGASPFHVRLARHRLAALPADVREAIETPAPRSSDYPTGDLFGYLPGAAKALRRDNEFTPGALRMDYPYRNLDLLRFFAGLPVALLDDADTDRAVARMMLDDRLPDTIRLRRTGMPASPDHLVRMQRQAPAALARIAGWRAAGIDDWIDLDWLESALARVAAHGLSGHVVANEVQLTAMTAEYLVWLQQAGVPADDRPLGGPDVERQADAPLVGPVGIGPMIDVRRKQDQ